MSLKNMCACMEKASGGKTPGTRRGSYHSMLTNRGEHSIRRPGAIKEGYHSMLNNPGEHSAASYFKETLDTSPSLHLATSVAE